MMSKKVLYLVSFLFVASVVVAQSKQSVSTKPAGSDLKKIIVATGFPYRMVNDSLAVIPFEGANISTYNVLIQKISDLYIVYTNLTESIPAKINNGNYKYLLQQNDHYDIIKIGIGSDDIAYVRADVYKSSVSTAILTRIIKQVANVTNLIAGDLK